MIQPEPPERADLKYPFCHGFVRHHNGRIKSRWTHGYEKSKISGGLIVTFCCFIQETIIVHGIIVNGTIRTTYSRIET